MYTPMFSLILLLSIFRVDYSYIYSRHDVFLRRVSLSGVAFKDLDDSKMANEKFIVVPIFNATPKRMYLEYGPKDELSSFMALAADALSALDKIGAHNLSILAEEDWALLALYIATKRVGVISTIILVNPIIGSSGNSRIPSPLGISDLMSTLPHAISDARFVMDDLWRCVKARVLICNDCRNRMACSDSEYLMNAMNETWVESIEIELPPSLPWKAVDLSYAISESRTFSVTGDDADGSYEAISKPPVGGRIDCPLPSSEDLKKLESDFGALLEAFSCVFLSRDAQGNMVEGIENVPTGKGGRPVLLVGNHQLYGGDIIPIAREFLLRKGSLIRGLAHPMMFEDEERAAAGQKEVVPIALRRRVLLREDGTVRNATMLKRWRRNANIVRGSSITCRAADAVPAFSDPLDVISVYKKFGAVRISPGSIAELMRRNETILLYPGGARECFHLKGQQYKLFWPEKTDFIRMAAAFDAIVVPFASIGISDSVNMIFDSEEILKMPIFGERARRFSDRYSSARAGVKDNLVMPVSVPSLPSRLYVLFQQPFDTRGLDVYDKKACARAYGEIRDRVQAGIDTLLHLRENDIFRDYPPRRIFQLLSGASRGATHWFAQKFLRVNSGSTGTGSGVSPRTGKGENSSEYEGMELTRVPLPPLPRAS